MSAYGIHPTFADLDSYRAWLRTWRRLYGKVSADLRRANALRKQALTAWEGGPEAQAEHESAVRYKKVMATKLLSARETAKVRWRRILDMQEQVAAQEASYPIDLGRCAVVDMHYNKGSGEFPKILPMWTLKVKGRQLFLNHIDVGAVPFSTRELPDGQTRGMLRFRHVYLTIDADGVGHIEPAPST
jgi:hypothetical protein